MEFSKVFEGNSGYILLGGALIINMCLQGSSFFTMNSIGSLFSSNLPLLMAALAQMIIMSAGGIDISIGNTMAFANGLIIVFSNTYGLSFGISAVLAVVAGMAIGMMNGVIIAYFRVPPLLVTFAMSIFMKGLSLTVLPKPGGNVPASVYQTYWGMVMGIPISLLIIVVAVIILILAGKIPHINHLTAVGSNERNAYSCGVNVERVKIMVYALGGTLAACAGVCLTALTATGDVRTGEAFALQSIAAVIIGGMNGSGKWHRYVLGAICGALFLAIVNNIVFYAFTYISMNHPGLNISTYYQQLLSNFIIIFGLMSAMLTGMKKKRRVQ